MPVSYEHDPDRQTVQVYVTGVFSALDIADYALRLEKQPKIADGLIEIVHFSGVRDFLISYKEAEMLRSIFTRLKERTGYVGVILIGETDDQFGMARMLAGMLDECILVIPVRTMEEAERELAELRGAAQTAATT